jgi:outer membrane protein OmpA-like peptidoglycan-associated protein
MKARLVIACFVWLFILLIGVGVWRYFVAPAREVAQEKAKQELHQKTILMTGSESRYRTQINYAFDSFSGYCVERSPEFEAELGRKRIKVKLVDDNADYVARLKAIQSGEIQMASFTIDALIKASAEIGDMPATIVAIIDETRGADAMVGYKTTIANIDALNDPDMKFVLTPNTPSETLARVVMSHFGLSNLSDKSFIEAKDAADVYNRYRKSKPTDKLAFVLWEPYVTKMLENPNVAVLVDSSRFRGYIVDVIVASRDFLVKDEPAVKDFVEAYFRSLYTHTQKTAGMSILVANDAQKAGTPLNDKQTQRLVDGIWWKNTNENYAHMGLNNDKPLQHVEDMIQNITSVLISTGAIANDPANGQPNLLFHNGILAQLQNDNFHPGVVEESIRKDSDNLPSLSDEEWKKLIPVGTLQVPKIVFARGTARITEQSEITLNELIEKLQSWPNYYVKIIGNASLNGDLTANRNLAKSRAISVENYLKEHGINDARLKSLSVEPTGNTDVVFQLGYTPY